MWGHQARKQQVSAALQVSPEALARLAPAAEFAEVLPRAGAAQRLAVAAPQRRGTGAAASRNVAPGAMASRCAPEPLLVIQGAASLNAFPRAASSRSAAARRLAVLDVMSRCAFPGEAALIRRSLPAYRRLAEANPLPRTPWEPVSIQAAPQAPVRVARQTARTLRASPPAAARDCPSAGARSRWWLRPATD